MWVEPASNNPSDSSRMADAVFRIACERLAVDHAAELAEAVCSQAPGIEKSAHSGVHPVHVAGTQNGWERPEHANAFLQLSKRTPLRIRVELSYANELINLLAGKTLNVGGNTIDVLSGKVRTLSPAATLFSRYLYFPSPDINNCEQAFVNQVSKECQQYKFSPTKILCGREHVISTNKGKQLTRSVLLADVPAVSSVTLQEQGLGEGRTMGCGLFIPHKDTGAVNETTGSGL